jgi:hypothetical protein
MFNCNFLGNKGKYITFAALINCENVINGN